MTAPLQPTVDTHNDFGTANVVETPTSPSSSFTLSRFEFEAGTKGNEGTKILMVEWDAAAALKAGTKQDGEKGAQSSEGATTPTTLKASTDDWEIRWDGKEVLHTMMGIPDPDTPPSTCRVYFLLPPKAPIPTLVTIAHSKSAVADLHAKPLPAIFPEGLVKQQHGGEPSAKDKDSTKKPLGSGTRGVLHTIWAERRVAQLDAEVEAEMRVNGEGVGLEMALQERQWIVERFGLQIDTSSAEAIPPAPGAGSPASPRNPLGGRLGEKLKGLKLATSPAELAAAKEAANQHQHQTKKITAVVPDSATAGFQPRPMATGSAAGGGMASLSAVMQGGGGVPDRGGDTEEDLFALPMSPRSPEMIMSPFSLLKS